MLYVMFFVEKSDFINLRKIFSKWFRKFGGLCKNLQKLNLLHLDEPSSHRVLPKEKHPTSASTVMWHGGMSSSLESVEGQIAQWFPENSKSRFFCQNEGSINLHPPKICIHFSSMGYIFGINLKFLLIFFLEPRYYREKEVFFWFWFTSPFITIVTPRCYGVVFEVMLRDLLEPVELGKVKFFGGWTPFLLGRIQTSLRNMPWRRRRVGVMEGI